MEFLRKERKLASEDSSKKIYELAMGLQKEVIKLRECEIEPDYKKAKKSVKILNDIKDITDAALKRSKYRVKYEYL